MSNIILAIDTSIDYCSVAIYKKQHIYFLSEKCKKKHTSQVLPMLKKLLFQTKTTFQELNYIGFAKGPGNFTSIRIAASIAQSLSLSLKIPIISISTLLIIAEKTWRKYKKKNVIVIMQAKKTHVYWAQYIRNQESIWIGEHTESLIKTESIKDKMNKLEKNWTCVGNGSKIIEYKNISNSIKDDVFFPEAQDIIPFILLKIKNRAFFYSTNTELNYLYNNF
ncbi:tRNA (adenosine(37)-N6)-threonylcarbamoyltransferase complex dimerization subunit type 1 TsaB [Buchnera aphidicola]|uniref:tRNA threonylcarbamoyladenosine biosynthesis protein TsaB n=1 Tax=Buchnera aphidicola str. USDA (Myzus persicae) TaxID=1009856 RepID=W0P3W8_BUCMP|nr:tRNA (adenosine(37)-N6)-threonylcarbamoyltransferase complex dimerization subunit type 1 TsaB [Buchnera aphidicola]AHG60060.1 Yeaz [Buchnera aphidicola str. USDA (Myzus persicae)]AHG60640.1 Yeaz [Buchnera aphidicola str. W106 (Myzus persicae)]AHG61212.1 Yeaz [Buchnera aphidicola str. G002 (Myzus persicae)]AHG61785.1 Yeaz [Buchnera aphidicola str. F009 (Myzus persicae)]WAI03255.1 MAG: tRNA (adenosine(37)-N6)-threonylcarbamoyltransferase complex dimerization subunit type 1 TsaB [Buchnera aphi